MPFPIKIHVSLMCCRILNLGEEVRRLSNSGCDAFHIDIMDGKFVKNFAMNFYEIRAIQSISTMPLDIHMMTDTPSSFVEELIKINPKNVTLHLESKENIIPTLHLLKKCGINTTIALNPETPPTDLTPKHLEQMDSILIMSVQPGFSGGKFVPNTYKKISRLKNYLMQRGQEKEIMVDGGINIHNIPLLAENGATAFVAGSTGLFFKGANYSTAIAKLKTAYYMNIGELA